MLTKNKKEKIIPITTYKLKSNFVNELKSISKNLYALRTRMWDFIYKNDSENMKKGLDYLFEQIDKLEKINIKFYKN